MTEAEKLVTLNLKYVKVYGVIRRLCQNANLVVEHFYKNPLVIYKVNTPPYHYLKFDKHTDSFEMASRVLSWLKRFKFEDGSNPKLYFCGPRCYRIKRDGGDPIKIGVFFYHVFKQLLKHRQDFRLISCGQTGVPTYAIAAATAAGIPVDVFMTNRMDRRHGRKIIKTPKEVFYAEIEDLRIKIKQKVKENDFEYIRKDKSDAGDQGRGFLSSETSSEIRDGRVSGDGCENAISISSPSG